MHAGAQCSRRRMADSRRYNRRPPAVLPNPMKLLGSFAVLAAAASLTACAVVSREQAAAPPPERLAGTSWLAEDIDGKGVLDRVQSTIEFIDETRVAGSLGCNRYTGSYRADATGLRFGDLASTRRMCPEAQMEQEGRFNGVLGTTRGLRFEPTGALTLLDADGRPRARMTPLPARK